MKTRSVDLAAYLHLCGVEPNKVLWDEKYRVREFHYAHDGRMEAAVEAFNGDAMVPVSAFCEARAMMKGKEHDRKVGNFRDAQRRVRRQL